MLTSYLYLIKFHLKEVFVELVIAYPLRDKHTYLKYFQFVINIHQTEHTHTERKKIVSFYVSKECKELVICINYISIYSTGSLFTRQQKKNRTTKDQPLLGICSSWRRQRSAGSIRERRRRDGRCHHWHRFFRSWQRHNAIQRQRTLLASVVRC